MKKRFAFLFSYHRLWQTPRSILLGSTRYFSNYGASYNNISLTPKRLLKTQIFEKKGYSSNEQNAEPNLFSHYRV